MTGIWLWITAAVMTYVAGPERVSATVVPDNLEVKDGRPEDETSYRDLETFPADLSVCDSYFFGHQAVLSPDKLPFCVNNGICKASWVNDPSQPCECSNAYAGPHCEFVAGQVPSTCHLGCRNGGTCKIGASSWQKYYRGKGGWTNPFDLQHCECPTGYTGLLCENAGTPCGDDSCRNGGSCIISSNPDGSNKYFCDCTTAISSDGVKKYAGQYCENEATSFCPQPTVDGRQFCVNGGTCRSDS